MWICNRSVMKTLIPHSSKCKAVFFVVACTDCLVLVCAIITLTTTCWETAEKWQGRSPLLLCYAPLHIAMLTAGPCSLTEANGVPSRQVTSRNHNVQEDCSHQARWQIRQHAQCFKIMLKLLKRHCCRLSDKWTAHPSSPPSSLFIGMSVCSLTLEW